MNPIATQQAALDNALVPHEKRLKIERCNARIAFSKPQKEETYQVTLEDLKLSLCYPAFQITAEVPEIYMHQFWNTIKKIRKADGYNFKLDKKCVELTPKYYVRFFRSIPDSLTKILWNFLQKEIYLYLSRNLVTMASVTCYLPFELIKCTSLKGCLLLSLTSVSLNPVGYVQSDECTLKFLSKIQDPQKYGALMPNGMINQEIKLSTAYKTYLDYAIGKVPPKKARKFKKPASPKLKTAALLEDAQLKKNLRKSKRETHKLQASNSSKGTDFESEVPDERTCKTKDTSKGTGVKPGVLNVSKEDSSDSDDDSWVDSEDESNDVHDEDDNDDDNDNDDEDGNDDDSGNDDDGG
uniref:Uncharacterized protein n=1 Tax=Tanacetum cinerariifolium TaxID=118510 RepID=A0A6L2P6V9_TANCI|nr:hypothetical protein [Tanacetum cinerariifolium]